MASAGARRVLLPLAGKRRIAIWQSVRRLAGLIEKFAVHIVHARSRAPAWSADALARRCGRRFVSAFRRIYGHARALERRYNAAIARAERVIAISQPIARHIEDVYGTPKTCIRDIHRGVDAIRFEPETVSTKRVMSLRRSRKVPVDKLVVFPSGRLVRWTGHTATIEARNLCRLIVGDHLGRGRCRTDMPAAHALCDIVVFALTGPETRGRAVVET